MEEKTMKPAHVLAMLLLALVSFAHFLRLLLRIDVVASGRVIPMWISIVGCLVPAGVAVALWRESRRV
jgi:hypothetical protein